MQLGVLLPQTEIGSDPVGLRDYAQAVHELGFAHLISYEHVLGAVPERLPKDYAPYGIQDAFNEILTTFAFMAAAAPELGLATAILVLPQRQTALVAKQAAQLNLLTSGRFRLGVGLGWNYAEFEGMGADFPTRARRMEEQIRVLRLLWGQDMVDFEGDFHKLQGVGIRPLPSAQPIWLGAAAEPAVRRAAQLGDGWFPLRPLAGGWEATFAQVRAWREAAGLSWESFGIEARVTPEPGWPDKVREWERLGATHVYVSTLGQGCRGPSAHIELLRRLQSDLRG